MNYFYADANNQPVGPVSAEQLHALYQAGVIILDTFVIPEGATDWHPYRSIAPTAAPPPPPAPVQTRPLSRRQQQQKKGGWFRLAIKTIGGSILFFALIGFLSTYESPIKPSTPSAQNSEKSDSPIPAPKPPPPPVQAPPPPSPPPNPKTEILRNLELNYTANKDGFGTILKVNLNFLNKSRYTVFDIVLEFETYGASGTPLTVKQQTIYQTIDPYSKLQVPDFNAGFVNQQTTKTSVTIIDFKYK